MTLENSPVAHWWVYLILCEGDRIYTGIAKDVQQRFVQHQAGKGAKFTRAFPPVSLLACCAFPDYSSALKEEHRIKQLRKPQKLQLIDAWSQNFSD